MYRVHPVVQGATAVQFAQERRYCTCAVHVLHEMDAVGRYLAEARHPAADVVDVVDGEVDLRLLRGREQVQHGVRRPATSRRFLAEFRAETASRLADAGILDLVARLREASPEFREGWDGHPVAGFVSRERIFHHPTVGTLRLEHHQLRASDRPDLQLVIYTPLDDVTRARLAQAGTQ